MNPLIQSKNGTILPVLIALMAPVTALLCMLSIAAEAGQMVGNIEVLDGPTPFIRFLHTHVMRCRQLRVRPVPDSAKKGSDTRPIRPAMRDLIWKRAVISIPKMANSPSRSSVSTPAAQTTS